MLKVYPDVLIISASVIVIIVIWRKSWVERLLKNIGQSECPPFQYSVSQLHKKNPSKASAAESSSKDDLPDENIRDVLLLAFIIPFHTPLSVQNTEHYMSSVCI
jgi:hypothetical protein